MRESLHAPPVLEVRGISKAYGAVRALSAVSLEVHAGEVHGLVGENGAGKSTLIRILSGALAPDGGQVLFLGAPADLSSPRKAADLGIAVAHQEPDLFECRGVVENCFLQERLPGGILISWSMARARARAALDRLAPGFPLERTAEELPASGRRIVSLAGALHLHAERGGPRLVILDEPTAALSRAESGRLFASLRELRDRGGSAIIVSHRLAEVLDLCDRVTVLRDGRVVLTEEAARIGPDALVEAMVGRKIEAFYPRAPAPREAAPILLEVEGLADLEADAFLDVAFTLRAGEVLGVYGLVGSGRSEMGQAVAGLRRSRGVVRSGGSIIYLPEDRIREGSLHGLSVRENLSISALPALSLGPFVDPRRERQLARSLTARLRIRTAGIEAEIGSLSGGNQQKALLGRSLAASPRILVLDEPTQGIDVGTKAEIHEEIERLARGGMAILLISSDLPEALGISHRLAVFREGRIVEVLESGRAREEDAAAAALPIAAAEERAEGEGRGEAKSSPMRRMLGRREPALLLVILAIVAATGVRSPDFLSLDGARGLAAGWAPLALASLGETVVIASGAIDISIGPMLAIAATAAGRYAEAGGGAAGGAAIAALLGAGLAALNALLSRAGRVPPILTTLGTLWIFQGAFLRWTGGEWLTLPPALLDLASSGPLGIPASAWSAVAFAAAVALFLGWTRPGRACLEAGDDPRAAWLHGLPVGRARLAAFLILGAAVGLAGVFHTARYGQVQSNTGAGFEVLAISAAVIGGARVSGGRGTVAGALLGAALIAVLQESRAAWGIEERWQLVGIGSLMLAALLVERGLARLAGRRPG